MEIVFRFTGERLVRKTVEAADAKVGQYHAVTKLHEGKRRCFRHLKLGRLFY
jgi:hypothetical protein